MSLIIRAEEEDGDFFCQSLKERQRRQLQKCGFRKVHHELGKENLSQTMKVKAF